MAYAIRIQNLDKVKRVLSTEFKPALRTATEAIAQQIQSEVAPYPAATVANSPAQRRWYERGFGQRWRTKSGAVHGRRTSQMMNRHWGIARSGQVGATLSNIATYSPYLHDADKQVRWAAPRGWRSDEYAIKRVVDTGAARRIVVQAIMAALRRRGYRA